MHEIQLTIIAKNIMFQNEVLLIKTTITVMQVTKSCANRPKKNLEERKDYQFNWLAQWLKFKQIP